MILMNKNDTRYTHDMYTLFSPESNTRERLKSENRNQVERKQETNGENQNAVIVRFCVNDCEFKNTDETLKHDKRCDYIHVIDLLQCS